MTTLFDLTGKNKMKFNSTIAEAILRENLPSMVDMGEIPNGNKFNNSNVFLINIDEGKIKVRICSSEEQAKKIYENTSIAYEHFINCSKPFGVYSSLFLSTYREGSFFMPIRRNIESAAKIHAEINNIPVDTNVDFRETVLKFMKQCGDLIKSKLGFSVEGKLEFPKTYIPVFDHRDYGPHNIIIDPFGNLVVIDEESFDINPFGYSLIRPLRGDSGDNFCNTEEEYEDYLKNYGALKNIDYFLETRKFWEAFYYIRTAARRIINLNMDSAKTMIEELEVIVENE